jgi:hypothetical protein
MPLSENHPSPAVLFEETPDQPKNLTSVLAYLQGIISGPTHRRLVSAIEEFSNDAYERGLCEGRKRLSGN